jgi:hypothetical protein
VRRLWLVVTLTAVFALVIAWSAWRAQTRQNAPVHLLTSMPAPVTTPTAASGERNAQSNKTSAGVTAHSEVIDPLGSAPDLKRVFDDYVHSANPQQRRLAVRSFEACVPTFLPGAGQMPSPEPLIAALPTGQRADREAAYRELFGRCYRLLGSGGDALDGMRQTLERDPQNQGPGLRARESLLAGRLDQIEPLVAEASSSANPADLASLAGLATTIVRSRGSDGVDPDSLKRAQEVDAALALLPCDLGLDCGAQSLWALQLCVSEGLCTGDYAARLNARNAPGSVDPSAVQQQRLRLLNLIRGGRALGSSDLMPP